MAIKKILVSQAAPKASSPYEALTNKYGVSFDFAPFHKTEAISSIEIRAQRCNPLDYSAVVFSSRNTIDAFFKLCEDLRVKIPETMKYFCTTEMVAMYLQKHIVYRKRKIFFGDGTPASVLALITAKHKNDNFLIVTANSPESSITKAFDETAFKHTGVMFARSSSLDLSSIDINSYDMLVLYNKYDVVALQSNFPDFTQGDRALVTYGSESLRTAATQAGFNISISAPNAECPTVVSAIENYLKK